jgi:hypothetical protein
MPSLRRASGRSEVLTAKIKDLESKITTTLLQLDVDLRATSCLAILTPFQRATPNHLPLDLSRNVPNCSDLILRSSDAIGTS